MADPLPTGVSETLPEGVYPQGATAPPTWYQKFSKMATEGMTGALFGSESMPLPGGLHYPAMTETGRQATQMLPFSPPPTEAGLGAMAGTMATAPFTGGMSVPLGMAYRTLGAGIGAQAGALASGEDPMSTALQYGLATLGGEAAGYGIGKILRSAPGAQSRIQRNRFDTTAEAIAHDLPGLRELSFPEIKVKAMSNGPDGFRRFNGDRLDAAMTEVQSLIGNQGVYAPTLGSSKMPLPDAVRKLQDIAQAGFGGNKDILREYPGKTAREVWQQGLDEIKSNLSTLNPTGEALTLFESSRQQWARTNAMINLFRISKGGDAFIGAPNRVDINFNRLREKFERNYSKFESTMAPDDFERFKVSVYAGGPVGSRDVLGSQQSVTGAGSQLLRSGGGTGTLGVLPIRTGLPGAGDTYTGALPYGSPMLPAGMDIGSQKAMQLLRPNVEIPQP